MTDKALEAYAVKRRSKRSDGTLPAAPVRHRVTPKNRELIAAIIQSAELTISDLAERVGITERGARKALCNPAVKAELDRQLRETLGTRGFALATSRVMHLLGSAQSERVQADLAKHVLAVNGVTPSGPRSGRPGEGLRLRIVLSPNSPGESATVIEHSTGETPPSVAASVTEGETAP